MAKQIYYFDMDGVLCNFHKEPYKYENATNREWIANLDPFMDNVNLVRRLITEGKSVYILTAGANNEARKGKLDWLAKYIPELNKRRFICIVGSKGRKVDKRKTKSGMLIDDKIANLKPWAKEGLPIYWVKERGARVEL